MKKGIILFSSAIIFSFFGCGSNENEHKEDSEKELTKTEKQQYKVKGREIAKATFKTLSGELIEKINTGGIASAIDYCNVAAMPLTDSLSKVYEVQIRRVSDKLRNPSNSPDSLDLVILAEYDRQMKAGEKPRPVVTEIDGQVRFSAPIFTKPLCLNCHGDTDKYIAVNDLELIQERYPNDRATGYQTGDLRGAWSITFSR